MQVSNHEGKMTGIHSYGHGLDSDGAAECVLTGSVPAGSLCGCFRLVSVESRVYYLEDGLLLLSDGFEAVAPFGMRQRRKSMREIAEAILLAEDFRRSTG
jgi:hypothetical protein